MHTHPTCQKWQSVLGTFLCSLFVFSSIVPLAILTNIFFSPSINGVCATLVPTRSFYIGPSQYDRLNHHQPCFCYFERLIKVEKFHWMPLKFQKLDRRDFSESECFSSPHSLKYNGFSLLWDGWRYQNGWFCGEVRKGGGGSFPIQKIILQILGLQGFSEKMQYKLPKIRGVGGGGGSKAVIFSTKMLEEGSMPNIVALNVSNSFQPAA